MKSSLCRGSTPSMVRGSGSLAPGGYPALSAAASRDEKSVSHAFLTLSLSSFHRLPRSCPSAPSFPSRASAPFRMISMANACLQLPTPQVPAPLSGGVVSVVAGFVHYPHVSSRIRSWSWSSYGCLEEPSVARFASAERHATRPASCQASILRPVRHCFFAWFPCNALSLGLSFSIRSIFLARFHFLTAFLSG